VAFTLRKQQQQKRSTIMRLSRHTALIYQLCHGATSHSRCQLLTTLGTKNYNGHNYRIPSTMTEGTYSKTQR